MKHRKKNGTALPMVAIVFLLQLIGVTGGYAQEKITVQVKTFTQQLEPYRNIEVSINGRPYIALGSRGLVVTDLSSADFPIKSVSLKDPKLEAASWLFTKGVVEIIIRAKSYQIAKVVLRTAANAPIAGVPLTFKGKKSLEATSDSQGRLSLPLALDESITSANQFIAGAGYAIKSISTTTAETTIILEPPAIVTSVAPQQPVVSASRKEFIKDFKLTMLDSIQSLTLFYTIFKGYEINDLSPEMKKRVDAKFNELVRALQDSVQQTQRSFVGRINDSTLVREDIANLVNQARQESETLTSQRDAFDEKIRIITNKLDAGISNMDDKTRSELLSELSLLEQLLIENESRFFKNQSDYRSIINAIKEKYFNITALEDKLSESEAQRLEEQRIFRQRLLLISAILLLFGILIVLLILARKKLKTQTMELAQANKEIKNINENLEHLVLVRTKSLAEANKELDTFLYRASHDMRSPVRSIIGLCNIAGLLVDGEPKELINKVVSTTVGMDKLLKKLSLISEINAPSDFTEINIKDTITEIQRELTPTVGARSRFVVTGRPDVTVYSYRNLVQTILYNVIENGLIYGALDNQRQPEVQVHVVSDDKNVSITVTDNGPGFNGFVKERLFEMFFKGTEKSPGHGLGLYIVNKAIQAIDGKIEVESEEGAYGKFKVIIPINAKAASDTLEHKAVA
jgi:signal transduction histidine kinase